MRLHPILRILIGLATAAPFLILLLPVAFMALVAIGLWDPAAQFLVAKIPTLESIGWNAALALGFLFTVLNFALVVFYLSHIITNQSAPGIVRVGFAVSILIIPFVAMTAYWFLYVLPEKPPTWALKASKPFPDTTRLPTT
jgi:hypothetical protein